MKRGIVICLLLIFSRISFSQVNLAQGLVAYYPFNGSTNDFSGNTNHGILQNGPQLTTDRFGNPNSAYAFDGIDDYITIPASPSLNASGGRSVVFYFNPAKHGTQTLIGRINYSLGVGIEFQFAIDFSLFPGILFGTNPASNGCTGIPLNANYCFTNNTVNLNQWYCVVGTFENGIQKFYVNGLLIQTINTTYTALNNCPNADIQLGRWWSGDFQSFQGKIDDVRLYNRALTLDEVNVLCSPYQVTANFDLPDTVCAKTPINITNTSVNATTYYWNFCSGSLNAIPNGSNLAPAGLSSPVFGDIIQEGTNYYLFTVNHTGSLSRMDFGTSLLNAPTATNLGSFGGIIPSQAEGIEIQKEGNIWIGYIIGGQNANSRLVKLKFGSALSNVPTATNLGNIGGLSFPVDFALTKNGVNWHGFTISADNNTVTRFDFGNSLDNTPSAVNLGNIGNLSYPSGFFIINDGANHHMFIANRNSNSISRLDFGLSFANNPTGTNLGNPGNNFALPRDINVIKDCDRIFGFVVNETNNTVTRLDFNSNLSSVPVTTNLGNIGNLNFPHSISEIFRTGDAVNFFVPNVNSNSITRITFNNCNSSSIPSSTQINPLPFQYSTVGEYNISLFVDEGLPTQTVVCKKIVVTQCEREISGVINDYTPVLSLDPCKNTLTVADATNYHAGDTVLLIQMKGAVIDTSNTAAFGTITDYRNAGNYEFNYIKSKTGNVIELKNFLLRQYNVPDGKVQLIRVPYYEQAIISAPLTCLPWDGEKGGVVAVNVKNTLQIDANIDVTGKGFRGGIDPFSNPAQMNCNENQYYYPANPDVASGKGEGIAEVSVAKSFGRGALANGGGGGNSHNSGGGGGSNVAAGGYGGYNYEGVPCTSSPFDNRGIGGKTLAYNNTANKIFMGGGGGAGHTNNPEGFQALGGNGSGIVIITADTLKGGNGSIRAFGINGPECSGLGATGCHEGMGGGGAGGTILLNVNNYLGDIGWNTKGGSGAHVDGTGIGRLGPGGGASGGVAWLKSPSIPPNIVAQANSGGGGGVNLAYGSDTWGSTSGGNGTALFDLQVPISTIPFKPNIDSVRIKDSLTGCRTFDFKGLGYTNNNPVVGWQWHFGDGNTANTQNTTHTYPGVTNYTVKLVVTDINGCKDSITTDVTTTSVDIDFNYEVDVCDPLVVQFHGLGPNIQNLYWEFGDANTLNGSLNPVHTYPSQGSYTIRYGASNGICTDTISKTINLSIINDDIITTRDTTICAGTTKKLLTTPGLSFCWSPATYLDNPGSATPTTSTPQNITYYYTAETTGSNLIVNGDFSQGNSGFTSGYVYNANSGLSEGVYNVGSNIPAWHPSMPGCQDHTSGSGNMMMVNGDAQANTIVWSQTITIQPNTNYAFSAWLQHITTLNPASLRFTINGSQIGNVLQANSTSCVWDRFYTVWNSGNANTAVISIVNQNLVTSGNDFALDDISFAPMFIKRDSVTITVETPSVKTNDNTVICQGESVQLNAIGAASYSWSPATGLSNTTIANPVATPGATIQYIVSGTSANGCIAKDSIDITVIPKPVIDKTRDTAICKNSSLQLFATGGSSYLWSPSTTLNDASVANPIASPPGPTTYYVLVTGANACTNMDSVKLSIRPDPVFTISPNGSVCEKSSVQLTAGGGDTYSWQPAGSLSNSSVSNPLATPGSTTNYSVLITETTCNQSTTLSTTVSVNPLPVVTATKTTDIDCSNDRSQLNASGAQTYSWLPVTTLDNPFTSDPVASPTSATMYVVKGTDALGCVNYDSVKVEVLSTNASGYHMPAAFTPNGDGLNDCYGIRFWGIIQELEFSIYNRWGELIFYSKNPTACWNGIYKGKQQDIGVYVYMIKAKTSCGDTFKKGFFTLVR